LPCHSNKLRRVSVEEGEAFARQHRMGFIEVSSGTTTNVNEIFIELVRRIWNWQDKNPKRNTLPKPLRKKYFTFNRKNFNYLTFLNEY